jgi:UDP-glucose 4-epimerase
MLNMVKPSGFTRHFVTGGAGFIGSHLVDRLLAEGNKVTVYDNLSAGKKANLASHLDKKNFRFHHADGLDLETLSAAMRGHQVIWHLAANSDIPGGNQNTELDLKNGTTVTRNVLEAMRRNKIDKILFSSSSTVYGDVPLLALAETHGPLLPISLYGASKLACEGLLSAYSHLFNIKAWVFRFGNVLGTRMGHGVIRDFILKLKKNPRELEILGDGNQRKNYFLIEDCLDGMAWAFGHAKKRCDVFNLGCETTVTVKEIAGIVVEEMGLSDVKFKYAGGVRGWPGDAPYVWYDLGKMKKLGWSARHTSAEAVRIAARRLIDADK